MKTRLRLAALALTALTVVTTTACTAPPIQTASGTVTRYHPDTDWGSEGSGYFEFEGQNAIYYCATRRAKMCLTTSDGDHITVQYYVNAHDYRIITSLAREQ